MKFFLRKREVQMDPAGVGALIGISIMTGVFVGLKLCDLYTKRKQGQNRFSPAPHPSKEEKRPFLVMKRHWKMKDLSIPKSYILHNLTIRKF
jgi:hypothetical protein